MRYLECDVVIITTGRFRLPASELTHFPIQFGVTPTFGYAPSSKFASLIFGSLLVFFFFLIVLHSPYTQID